MGYNTLCIRGYLSPTKFFAYTGKFIPNTEKERILNELGDQMYLKTHRDEQGTV